MEFEGFHAIPTHPLPAFDNSFDQIYDEDGVAIAVGWPHKFIAIKWPTIIFSFDVALLTTTHSFTMSSK